MKRTVSYILIFTVLLSICSFFSVAIFSVKAEDNTRDFYNKTNTYDVDDIIRNSKTNVGEDKKYKEDQFIITYKKIKITNK